MSATPVTISEYDTIARVVERYIEGARSGHSSDMRPAFHEEATIFGYLGKDFIAGPIEVLFAWNDENGPANEIQARIAAIDLVNSAATVRVELGDWTGYRFTDLLTLLKVEGQWKIMNKVFHLHS